MFKAKCPPPASPPLVQRVPRPATNKEPASSCFLTSRSPLLLYSPPPLLLHWGRIFKKGPYRDSLWGRRRLEPHPPPRCPVERALLSNRAERAVGFARNFTSCGHLSNRLHGCFCAETPLFYFLFFPLRITTLDPRFSINGAPFQRQRDQTRQPTGSHIRLFCSPIRVLLLFYEW